MQGTITLELTTSTPDSGSGLPDLGHDAYWLKKKIPELEFKDANGKMRKLGTKYEVSRINVETR